MYYNFLDASSIIFSTGRVRVNQSKLLREDARNNPCNGEEKNVR